MEWIGIGILIAIGMYVAPYVLTLAGLVLVGILKVIALPFVLIGKVFSEISKSNSISEENKKARSELIEELLKKNEERKKNGR